MLHKGSRRTLIYHPGGDPRAAAPLNQKESVELFWASDYDAFWTFSAGGFPETFH